MQVLCRHCQPRHGHAAVPCRPANTTTVLCGSPLTICNVPASAGAFACRTLPSFLHSAAVSVSASPTSKIADLQQSCRPLIMRSSIIHKARLCRRHTSLNRAHQDRIKRDLDNNNRPAQSSGMHSHSSAHNEHHACMRQRSWYWLHTSVNGAASNAGMHEAWSALHKTHPQHSSKHQE